VRFSGAGGWVARPVSLHRFISSDDACARHGMQKFASPNAFTTGADFKAYLRETFDALYSEGAAGSPKMMSVGLHCRLAGRPGRAAALAEFVDYVQALPNVWLCTRQQIAEHWLAKFPPQPSP
jgi:allantoinase